MTKWIDPTIAAQHLTADQWPVMVYNNNTRRWVKFRTSAELQDATLDAAEDNGDLLCFENLTPQEQYEANMTLNLNLMANDTQRILDNTFKPESTPVESFPILSAGEEWSDYLAANGLKVDAGSSWEWLPHPTRPGQFVVKVGVASSIPGPVE